MLVMAGDDRHGAGQPGIHVHHAPLDPDAPSRRDGLRVAGLSDVLCEVGVTDAARGAGKAIHDQAEDQVRGGWGVWLRWS